MTGRRLLARGVLVATLATLAAGLFFSAGVDYKTWLLLALGPVLLHAAGRSSAQPRRSDADRPAAHPPDRPACLSIRRPRDQRRADVELPHQESRGRDAGRGVGDRRAMAAPLAP